MPCNLPPFGFLGEVSIASNKATDVCAAVFTNPARKSLRIVIFSLLDKFVSCFGYNNTIGNVIILGLQVPRFCVFYNKLRLIVK